MRIIPALDLMNGVVVRGIAGRRSEYRPLVSGLTFSCQPTDVAAALHAHFGFTEFYLADLDALAGAAPAWNVLTALRARGFRLWLDAGMVNLADAQALAEAGLASIVAGLETVGSPDALQSIAAQFGERVVFSLDLRDGVPLGNLPQWDEPDADSIAAQAIALGVRRVLILDLARVGVGSGTGTIELCARLAARNPHVEISAGGGVRDRSDLDRLRAAGVRCALVASALHDGRLRPGDLTFHV